jgi:lysophospholipase L1-like esterase
MTSRLLRTLLAAGTLAIALIAPPASATPSAPSMVALGDSYASGPLIPVQGSDPWGCLRSDHNYAHQLAAELGLSLTDVTCSGADTGDMWGPQHVSPDKEFGQYLGYGGGGNPAQLEALTADTDLVTLQIGGNDIGFGSIATNCGQDAIQQKPCSDRYQENGRDTLHDKIDATLTDVEAVLTEIHARAPEARVLVLGYPGIFSLDPATPECPAMGAGHDDAEYMRDVEVRLNHMIETAAASTDFAEYVDVYNPSAGHTACDTPVLRWVEPIVPVNAAAPVHPNLTGMSAIEDILRDEVCVPHRALPSNARGNGPWTCPAPSPLPF